MINVSDPKSSRKSAGHPTSPVDVSMYWCVCVCTFVGRSHIYKSLCSNLRIEAVQSWVQVVGWPFQHLFPTNQRRSWLSAMAISKQIEKTPQSFSNLMHQEFVYFSPGREQIDPSHLTRHVIPFCVPFEQNPVGGHKPSAPSHRWSSAIAFAIQEAMMESLHSSSFIGYWTTVIVGYNFTNSCMILQARILIFKSILAGRGSGSCDSFA